MQCRFNTLFVTLIFLLWLLALLPFHQWNTHVSIKKGLYNKYTIFSGVTFKGTPCQNNNTLPLPLFCSIGWKPLRRAEPTRQFGAEPQIRMVSSPINRHRPVWWMRGRWWSWAEGIYAGTTKDQGVMEGSGTLKDGFCQCTVKGIVTHKYWVFETYGYEFKYAKRAGIHDHVVLVLWH